MIDASEELLSVFCDGKTFSFVRSNRDAGSTYGGRLDEKVSGCTFGPRRLHKLGQLTASSISGLSSPRNVFGLPLVYGFHFDGCLLKYGFGANTVEVLSISPAQSSEDWPYINYPPLLPRLPIEALPPRIEQWRQFSERFPNLPTTQSADLIAVAPPVFTIGHSMWGPSGDHEGVSVVFECDLGQQIVTSYNVCS